MKIEFEEVLKLIMQFLYEHKMIKTYYCLKEEIGMDSNFLPSVNTLKVILIYRTACIKASGSDCYTN